MPYQYLSRSLYPHHQALNPSIWKSRNSLSSPRMKPNASSRCPSTMSFYMRLITQHIVPSPNRRDALGANASHCPHHHRALQTRVQIFRLSHLSQNLRMIHVFMAIRIGCLRHMGRSQRKSHTDGHIPLLGQATSQTSSECNQTLLSG